jgi:hypothetical protein
VSLIYLLILFSCLNIISTTSHVGVILKNLIRGTYSPICNTVPFLSQCFSTESCHTMEAVFSIAQPQLFHIYHSASWWMFPFLVDCQLCGPRTFKYIKSFNH